MAQDETFIYQADKSNEWFTPPRYIEAARQVMGSIDLDPASCAQANNIVKATWYYEQWENGLTKPWYGNVWLNPPYGRSINYDKGNAGIFASRLVAEYRAGNVKQAILLTTVQNDARWFHQLWQFSICFSDHKIHFYTTAPTKKSPTATHMFGTAFVYMGEQTERFREVFRRFGVVVPPMLQEGQQELWSA